MAQRSAGFDSRQMPVAIFNLAVHQDILHALRKLSRFGVRGFVDDGPRIEHGHVGKETFLEQAASAEMFPLRRQRGDLAHRLFQRQQMQIAAVVPQKPRHRPKRAGMGVRLKEQSVQGQLAGIETDAGPRLLQAVLQVVFAGDEIERASLAVGRRE